MKRLDKAAAGARGRAALRTQTFSPTAVPRKISAVSLPALGEGKQNYFAMQRTKTKASKRQHP